MRTDKPSLFDENFFSNKQEQELAKLFELLLIDVERQTGCSKTKSAAGNILSWWVGGPRQKIVSIEDHIKRSPQPARPAHHLEV